MYIIELITFFVLICLIGSDQNRLHFCPNYQQVFYVILWEKISLQERCQGKSWNGHMDEVRVKLCFENHFNSHFLKVIQHLCKIQTYIYYFIYGKNCKTFSPLKIYIIFLLGKKIQINLTCKIRRVIRDTHICRHFQ